MNGLLLVAGSDYSGDGKDSNETSGSSSVVAGVALGGGLDWLVLGGEGPIETSVAFGGGLDWLLGGLDWLLGRLDWLLRGEAKAHTFHDGLSQSLDIVTDPVDEIFNVLTDWLKGVSSHTIELIRLGLVLVADGLELVSDGSSGLTDGFEPRVEFLLRGAFEGEFHVLTTFLQHNGADTLGVLWVPGHEPVLWGTVDVPEGFTIDGNGVDDGVG